MFSEQMEVLLKLVGAFSVCFYLVAFLCWLVLPLDIIRNCIRGNVK